jgi:hypothetical protein
MTALTVSVFVTLSLKADKMNYKEITLPAGTFRCYPEIDPYKWVEVPRDDGYANWLERGTAMSAKSKK